MTHLKKKEKINGQKGPFINSHKKKEKKRRLPEFKKKEKMKGQKEPLKNSHRKKKRVVQTNVRMYGS